MLSVTLSAVTARPTEALAHVCTAVPGMLSTTIQRYSSCVTAVHNALLNTTHNGAASNSTITRYAQHITQRYSACMQIVHKHCAHRSHNSSVSLHICMRTKLPLFQMSKTIHRKQLFSPPIFKYVPGASSSSG
jgi:hypothetical protein